jgi:hypothetical protein
MVLEPRAIIPHGIVRFVLHQQKYNTNDNEQQSVVKYHLQPRLNILEQVTHFVAGQEPKPYPAVHQSIDNTHSTTRTPANKGQQSSSRIRAHVALSILIRRLVQECRVPGHTHLTEPLSTTCSPVDAFGEWLYQYLDIVIAGPVAVRLVL